MAGVRNSRLSLAATGYSSCGMPRTVGLIGVMVSALWAGPETEWDKKYNYEYYDNARELIATDDGGFALVSEVMTDGYDLYGMLVRLDSSGDTLWTARYDSLGELFGTVKQTADNGFILGGKAVSSVVDFVLCKTDAQGVIEWINTYDIGAEDVITDIALAADGGYVALGTTTRATTDENLVVLKVDAGGDSLWAKEYYPSKRSQGRAIASLEDGDYLLGGFLQDTYRDAWLLRIDGSGNEIWSKTHNPGESLCEINDVIVTADGGFAAAGLFASGGIWGSGDRFWVLRTDADGDTLWTGYFDGGSGEQALRILETDDNGFVALGETESYGAGREDMWLIRLDAAGDSLWSYLVGSELRDLASGLAPTADSAWVIAGSAWNNSDERDLRVLKVTETVTSPGAGALAWTSFDRDTIWGEPNQHSVKALAVDADGTIICGTEGGAAEFDGHRWLGYQVGDNDNWRGVEAVAVASDGTRWYSGPAGTWSFNGDDLLDSADWTSHDLDIGDGQSVLVADDGAVWVAGDEGLARYHGAVWKSFSASDMGLATANVQDIAQALNGDIWIATYEGAAMYDGTAWTAYTTDDGMSDRQLVGVAVDSAGTVWLVRYYGGLISFKNGVFADFEAQQGEMLYARYMQSLAFAPDGAIWVRTDHQGLYRFDGEQWSEFGTEEGLLSLYTECRDMVFDSFGALWTGSAQGVSRYGPHPIPTADFVVDQVSGQAPLSVGFENRSSGEILEWFWDFGNGETSTDPNPTHLYDNAGTYTVTLTVSDDQFSDSRTCRGLIHVLDDGKTSAALPGVAPTVFRLSMMAPNPVRSMVTLDLSLPRSQQVGMRLVTVSGRQISAGHVRTLSAGRHRIRWDVSDVAPGQYMCLIRAGEYVAKKRLIISR